MAEVCEMLASQVTEAATQEELSACAKLAPKAPATDNHGTRLKLRLAPPPTWTAETAAEELMKAMKPEPSWVAAWTSDLVVDFVVVWGDRQPLRQKLKESVGKWLSVEMDTVKAAFKAAGVGSWRFDAIASLQLLQQQAQDRLSVACLLYTSPSPRDS